MVSHPELGLDPPIGSDRDSGHDMLCLSYHVIYHIHLICVYLSFSFTFHACVNFRSGYGKELYVPEGTITVRDSDLYLYDPNGAAIIIKAKSMSSTQTGPRYL